MYKIKVGTTVLSGIAGSIETARAIANDGKYEHMYVTIIDAVDGDLVEVVNDTPLGRIKRQIDNVNKQIDIMQENNDGSIGWVDDLRALLMKIDDLENELIALKDSEGGCY